MTKAQIWVVIGLACLWTILIPARWWIAPSVEVDRIQHLGGGAYLDTATGERYEAQEKLWVRTHGAISDAQGR